MELAQPHTGNRNSMGAKARAASPPPCCAALERTLGLTNPRVPSLGR